MKIVTFLCLAVPVAAILAGAWLYTPDKSRTTLEAEYGAAPGDFRAVAGLRLYLRDPGPRAGNVVILLHGFGSSLQSWDDWAQALQLRYRVVRFDLPGFGLTGPDPSGDYTDTRTVQVLLAVMDQPGIGRAALIGNSLGGKIAWMFAAAHPDQVPTLLVWGERDAMIPFSNAAGYSREIPRCRLVALAGIGHVPQEEAPAQSLAPVAEFLAE